MTKTRSSLVRRARWAWLPLCVVQLSAACGTSSSAPGASAGAASASVAGASSANGGSGGGSGGSSAAPGGAAGSTTSGAGTSNAGGASNGGSPGAVWSNIDLSVVDLSVDGDGLGFQTSGRIIAIRVDPRNPDVVYVGTQGGGVWKSTDYTRGQPTWAPMTDSAFVLTVGGMDLDPQNPDTIYVGLFEPYDTPEVTVIKSSDGGTDWSTPVYIPGANGVRDLRVDPGSRALLVATDAGLFRSTDGGASFARVVSDETWSLAFVGTSTWIVSSVTGAGGDLLRSTDDGVTWSSARDAGLLPDTTVQRMTVGAGDPSDPNATVLYVEATDPTSTHTMLFRSTDGGASYTEIGGNITNSAEGCSTTDNVVGVQGWFNQAVAVDPTDANHVLFGGTACNVRSLNGLASAPSWDWATPNGAAPVHVDWHAALVTNINGVVRTYSGNDGGIYSSTNLWTVPEGDENTIVWRDENAGLFTLLCDHLASGDPANGNGEAVMTGLQDNGVDYGSNTAGSWSIAEVAGGDGGPVAIGKGTSGEYLWVSPGYYCIRTPTQPCAPDYGSNNAWIPNPPAVSANDAYGGNLAPVASDPTGSAFLTNSQHNVWRTDTEENWTNISGTHCSAGNTNCATGGFDPSTNTTNVFASQTLAGHYGVTFDNNTLAITSDGDTSTPHWTVSGPLPGGSVQSLSFPATTPAGTQPGDVFLASFADSQLPKGSLYITRDRGATWQPLNGNGTGNDLPAGVGIQVVSYDASDPSNNTIYGGTNKGVYRTTDGGNTWARFGTGLPRVAVTGMFVARDGSLVRVSTKGRGVWEIHPRSM
jgi:hypothetical protein